jgi:hypothetical protein
MVLKAAAFVHRDVGHDLAVQFDPGQLHAVHEFAVGQAFDADSRVDALDPQATEGALLNLAVAISILAGLFDGLTGDANRILATAIIALGLFQNILVLGARGTRRV